ncbi:MAG: hypothetical protein WBE86_12950 [Candidatus Acidiferrales bacterium]
MRTGIVAVILLAIFIAGYHREQEHPQTTNVQKAGEQAPPEAIPPIASSASAEKKPSGYQKAKAYLWKATRPEYLAAWILVLAAGFGLWATFRTLRAIERQTALQGRQLDLLIARERPRIRIEVNSIRKPEPTIIAIAPEVTFVIRCICPTLAFIEEAVAETFYVGTLPPVGNNGYQIGIPSMIYKTMTFRREAISIYDSSNWDEIESGKRIVGFRARIRYRGIHLPDNVWIYETSIERKWVPYNIPAIGIYGYWQETDTKDTNT